jgi:uncharacterized protein (UPF0332 family)
MRERFENCLLKGNIIPVMPEWNDILLEIAEALGDLEASKHAHESRDGKWAIIAAYSSMIHSYRALILVKGFREKAGICLREAIDALYVEEGTIDPALLAGFREAQFLHNQALFEGVYSEPAARWATRLAETVFDVMNNLIPDT